MRRRPVFLWKKMRRRQDISNKNAKLSHKWIRFAFQPIGFEAALYTIIFMCVCLIFGKCVCACAFVFIWVCVAHWGNHTEYSRHRARRNMKFRRMRDHDCLSPSVPIPWIPCSDLSQYRKSPTHTHLHTHSHTLTHAHFLTHVQAQNSRMRQSTVKLSDGEEYQAQLSSNVSHGYGHAKFKNGCEYHGVWLNEQVHSWMYICIGWICTSLSYFWFLRWSSHWQSDTLIWSTDDNGLGPLCSPFEGPRRNLINVANISISMDSENRILKISLYKWGTQNLPLCTRKLVYMWLPTPPACYTPTPSLAFSFLSQVGSEYPT